ncbi:MAG TPA: alpha-L-glutamate ligase-like protein [Nitrospirales bacterium]|nr:alpha-L-glutamate ligase-like protein [Nitrospirales bacterium]
MFKAFRNLSKQGILGLNKRNAVYTLGFNQRRFYPFVDDKAQTKTLCSQAGMAVPELYGKIEIERQIRDLPKLLNTHTEFVIKPAHGSGGDGIVVIRGRVKDKYRKANGIILSLDTLQHHISNVLSGMYSLGGAADTALIEYCVNFDPIFESISYQGVPDIRIIVFLGVPVMSMVRLPTRMSDGKANLHQGALGVGVNMATGTTKTAVLLNEIVSEHPDTNNSVTGLVIPNWKDLLTLASQCYDIFKLGYLGVDIVLDRDQGPLLLEVNARPGLNIQIANCSGLLPRLHLVEQSARDLTSVQDRIEFAIRQFQS